MGAIGIFSTKNVSKFFPKNRMPQSCHKEEREGFMMKPSRIHASAVENWEFGKIPTQSESNRANEYQHNRLSDPLNTDRREGGREDRGRNGTERAGHRCTGRYSSGSDDIVRRNNPTLHCGCHVCAVRYGVAIGGLGASRSVVDRSRRIQSTCHTCQGGCPGITLQIHKLRDRDRSQHTQNHDHHHQLNQSKAALYLFHVVHLVKIIKIGSEQFIQHLTSHQRLIDSQILVLQHLVVREVCGLSV